jgi:hypothetical protein
MKTPLLILVSLATLAGCSFAARSPESYRDDVKAVLETKNVEIRACYDGVLKGTPGVAGKVTVKFDVADDTGKISNVQVDKAPTTAPDAVAQCVANSVNGLEIKPPDARLGQGTWVYEFAAPAAPPAPAAAPAPAPTKS